MQENDISTITKIRELACNSDSAHIRTPILSDELLSAFAEFAECKREWEVRELDIPVKNVFSVDRADLVSEGMTWLECLVGKEGMGLHGKGWPTDVFDYFERKIANNSFPHHKARGILECYSYNGVVGCRNGNHRLVAGVCYLASKFGANAVLKKVYTRCSSVNIDFIKTITQIYDESASTIRFAHRTFGSSWWCELDGLDRLLELDGDFYAFCDNEWHVINKKPSNKIKWPMRSDDGNAKVREALSKVNWMEIPRAVLETMLRNDKPLSEFR